ncbi:MAG: heparinase II/III family protein [Pseudomonadota bacterium]
MAGAIGVKGSTMNTAPRLRWRLPLEPYSTFLKPGVPERFLVAPPDVRPASKREASEYYNGCFAFCGQSVQVGNASLFSVQAPSQAWSDAAHSFRWMQNLAAAGGNLPVMQARALVQDWVTLCARKTNAPWYNTDVLAMRTIALLQYGSFVFTGADHAFYRTYMRFVSGQVRALHRVLPGEPDGRGRLRGFIALAIAMVALPVPQVMRDRAIARLDAALEVHVLPDGGVITRSPFDLADLTADLFVVAKCFKALDEPVPVGIVHALDRMLPRLEALTHTDGALAGFHGTSSEANDLIASLRVLDETRARATATAPQSGFMTLATGDARVVVDTGPEVGSRALNSPHDSLSAFEFSSGTERIFVNIGSAQVAGPQLTGAGRVAGGHCKVSVADVPATRPSAHNNAARSIKPWPDAGDGSSGGGDKGIVLHYTLNALPAERGLLLAADGRCLSGFDRVHLNGARQGQWQGPGALAGGGEYVLRFHLLPSVDAVVRGPGTVELTTSAGGVWRFETDAQRTAVEPSMYLMGRDGPATAKHIALRFDANGPDGDGDGDGRATASWRIEKIR